MKKFLVLYLIPPSVMDEWMKTPPEARKSEEERMSREIQEWMSSRSRMFSDPGAGLGKAVRVIQGSASDARNALVMYAIVQGETKEAVARDFQDHPHLQIPESSIEVMELFPLPAPAKA
ncbi:hypothetical protein [Piscinibacter sp. XHJ-5]|uniref:hypothetical protein n=1 Tax=Piscinibacter sp. XHJ-5 TaxID=3037797 RepID=UPI0024535C3B|nr:hypothetical protein [Piscinibacter sp. XHJ-5]